MTAESTRAIEIAEEQTQDVIDLLGFYVSFKHSKDYKAAVQIQGEMVRGQRTTFLLSSAEDAFQIFIHLDDRCETPCNNSQANLGHAWK